MTSCAYATGQEIRPGDRIVYRGELGHVDFVVDRPSGDPSKDWYLGAFPGGGVMIVLEALGSVFLGVNDVNEDFRLVERQGNAGT